MFIIFDILMHLFFKSMIVLKMNTNIYKINNKNKKSKYIPKYL